MRFTIIRSEDLVIIDNAVANVSVASLPANVEVVVYQETDGKIEYNDRPSVRTTFTDPSPYQDLINSFITNQSTLTPALQLAQAKQVKKDLVEGIFHHKRRLPYTYNGRIYEATDEAMAAMTAAMVTGTSGDTGGLVSSINTAFATLTGQINNQVVAVNNGSAVTVNSWSGTNATNWANVIRGAGDGHLYTTGYAPVNPGSGGFSSMSSLAGASVAAGGGSITWQPIGSPDPIALPGADLSGALGGIVARRNALNNNRVDKQAAIDALTTIPAIVAYDATTGWSF